MLSILALLKRIRIALFWIIPAPVCVCLGLSLASGSLLRTEERTYFDISYPRRIEGRIIDYPKRSEYRTTFDLAITKLKDKKSAYKCLGVARISILQRTELLTKGQKICLLVWLKGRPHSPFYLKRAGGGVRNQTPAYRGYLKADIEIETVQQAGLNALMVFSRAAIQSAIKDSGRAVAGILGGLILGDKRNIPSSVKACFRAAGLSHMLVISGFHIGLVFSFFLFLIRSVLLVWPFLIIRFNVRLIASLAALPFTVFYAMITGLPYPTLRAVLMLVTGVICLGFKRPLAGLNILFLVSLIILAFDPLAAYSVSFQLSFTAVFGIIYGLSRIRPVYLSFLKRVSPPHSLKRFFFMFFLDLTAISILANLFTLPLIVYYFERFSAVGIISNLIFVPAFSFVILPLGFLSGFLTVSGCYYVHLLWYAEFAVLDLVNRMIDLTGRIPFALVNVNRIYFEDVIFYYALLLALLSLPWNNKLKLLLFLVSLLLAIKISVF